LRGQRRELPLALAERGRRVGRDERERGGDVAGAPCGIARLEQPCERDERDVRRRRNDRRGGRGRRDRWRGDAGGQDQREEESEAVAVDQTRLR
jgi:hypothetical protein